MKWRLHGCRYGLTLGLVTLVIGAASDLRAQEPDPIRVQKNEPQPPNVVDEPAESKVEPNTPAGAAPDKGPAGASILDLDIEQLGKVQAKVPTAFDAVVTSVTSNKSTIGKSAAAVFVITNDMIRRSGATSIPETFRMVPGMQVAKVGASKWAISARGFNNQYANKLLVLVDGRSVYTPFFAGVYWETQDLVLQDVDHIEVIRGPGATVWGANAVNGVINIITKTAGNTQGTLVSSGGGDQDRTINAARVGGQIGDSAKYKVYVKQTDRAAGFNSQGLGPDDAWSTVRSGFRLDWDDPDQRDKLTLQGDMYFGAIGELSAFSQQTFPFNSNPPQNNHIGGGNVQGRWTHAVDEDNTYFFQSYYDRTARQDTEFDLAINIYDTQFQQNLKHSDNHVFTWGAGYRVVIDNIKGTFPQAGINPQALTYDQASLFFQEETPLFRDDLKLIVGSKFLYYYFTGFEYQPSARVLWEVNDKQVVWGAVSRAVRTPSRAEENVALTILNTQPTTSFINFQGGGRSLVSEELLAYEVGYRKQVTDHLSFELATFYNVYRNLISSAITGFVPAAPPTILTQFQNAQNAQSYGFELNGTWDVAESWKLRGWYSFMHIQLNGQDGAEPRIPQSNPRNQAYLMSSWDLPRNFEFDLMSRYVEDLPALNVPAYTTIDLRLGWRPPGNWEFSVIGQNLLAPHHLEFGGLTLVNSEVNRGVYAQVVWRH
jgi:iron complex outermembrane receptor protein